MSTMVDMADATVVVRTIFYNLYEQLFNREDSYQLRHPPNEISSLAFHTVDSLDLSFLDEDDQTGWMPSLIGVSTGYKEYSIGFRYRN